MSRLLARGRTCDIFTDGRARVRRRYRDGRTCAAEAELMLFLRSCGFPVPEVCDVAGPEIQMERVHGMSMLSDLTWHPWRLNAHARLLAQLHDQLHRLNAPSWLERPFGPGGSLLHGDLHPENVLLGRDGPMVIDWSAAAAGPAAADVAATWVLLQTSAIDGTRIRRVLVHAGRAAFLSAFLGAIDHEPALAVLPRVLQARLSDENLRPTERLRVAAMLEGIGR